MANAAQQRQLLQLLDWYVDAGVDAAVSDAPVNWLSDGGRILGAQFDWPGTQNDIASRPPAEQSSATPPSSQPNTPAPARQTRPATPLAASQAANEAREIAQKAQSLGELQEALNSFDGCSLKATASRLCFYRGADTARIMLIGEAPGRDEDLAGKPFVGRAGQLLDKMLAAIDLNESNVHITNIVYWRPPGNRTPTTQEALACRPFLNRQIELVKPEILVVLGGAAAKELLSAREGIMRLRGKWRDIDVGGKTLPILPTLHPAYLLRSPAAKKLAWQDLIRIRTSLDATK